MLRDTLLNEANKDRVIRAFANLVAQEMRSKSGLSGIAIRTAYGIVDKIQPGFTQKVVAKLLPEFVDALEPFAQGDDFSGLQQALGNKADQIADALLQVTDRRASRSSQAAIRGAYQKLRSSAKKHVVAAMPGIRQTLAPFL